MCDAWSEVPGGLLKDFDLALSCKDVEGAWESLSSAAVAYAAARAGSGELHKEPGKVVMSEEFPRPSGKEGQAGRSELDRGMVRFRRLGALLGFWPLGHFGWGHRGDLVHSALLRSEVKGSAWWDKLRSVSFRGALQRLLTEADKEVSQVAEQARKGRRRRWSDWCKKGPAPGHADRTAKVDGVRMVVDVEVWLRLRSR